MCYAEVPLQRQCKPSAESPSLLVCYAEVPLNFCKVNIYFLQIGCKCHSQPSPSLFHGFFIRRLDSVSSLSSHSVPMSVPFSANERFIQCKWEAHSVPMRPSYTTSCRLSANKPRLDTSLTPSWHLLDTSLWYKRHIYSLLPCGLTPWHLKVRKN